MGLFVLKHQSQAVTHSCLNPRGTDAGEKKILKNPRLFAARIPSQTPFAHLAWRGPTSQRGWGSTSQRAIPTLPWPPKPPENPRFSRAAGEINSPPEPLCAPSAAMDRGPKQNLPAELFGAELASRCWGPSRAAPAGIAAGISSCPAVLRRCRGRSSGEQPSTRQERERCLLQLLQNLSEQDLICRALPSSVARGAHPGNPGAARTPNNTRSSPRAVGNVSSAAFPLPSSSIHPSR